MGKLLKVGQILNNRDVKLDGLKFIMIYLVVLGHLEYNDYGLDLNKIIYSFHMPVFVFLSGYFTSTKTNRDKQKSWIKQFLLIYILAIFGHVLLEWLYPFTVCLYNHNTYSFNPFLLFKYLFSPRFALWYILCLIYWRLASWNIFSRIDDKTILIVSVVLSIVSGGVPIGYTLSFQRAFSFLPFFTFGYVFRKRNYMKILEQVPIYIPLILMLLGFSVSRHLPIYEPSTYYLSYHDFLLRIIQSIIALILCLSIIRISRSISVIDKCAKYGLYTLWIYIGHTYLISIGQKAFPIFGITLNVYTAIVLAIVYCALFIFLSKTYHSHMTKASNKDAS